MPTREEAELLAEVRREVADAIGLQIERADAQAILDRYADLMARKAAKEEAASKKKPRKRVAKKAKAVKPTPPSPSTMAAIAEERKAVAS